MATKGRKENRQRKRNLSFCIHLRDTYTHILYRKERKNERDTEQDDHHHQLTSGCVCVCLYFTSSKKRKREHKFSRQATRR